MSDDEADKQIDDIGVIARVTPEHKVRLVEVLKRKGHVVSMTGDGVNDAPALKKADIGVAMGITGTDVSKEAAVMILTDDNFATIIKAVELGRQLYDSLVKYIRFQMTRLFGFILMFLGAALFNVMDAIPFLPFQTLYLNFTVDLFLAIGLGLGAATPGLMERPPRGANAAILPTNKLMRLAVIGLVLAAVHADRDAGGAADDGRHRRAHDGRGDVRTRGHLPGAGDQRRIRHRVQLQDARKRQVAEDGAVLAPRDHRGDRDWALPAYLRHGVAEPQSVGHLRSRWRHSGAGHGNRQDLPARRRQGRRIPVLTKGSMESCL